jgi:hypothetical protein
MKLLHFSSHTVVRYGATGPPYLPSLQISAASFPSPFNFSHTTTYLPVTAHRGRGGGRVPATCDLAIIGGGINGCGIAHDAAGRGLAVHLCEMGDLAGGTSLRSTGLIHGGLRYLEHCDFRLAGNYG